MPATNLHRVDAILRYSLAVTAESDDPWDRELGPIHLLKGVYLADLAYAQRHGGRPSVERPGDSTISGPGISGCLESDL
jgi:hypothetical protein